MKAASDTKAADPTWTTALATITAKKDALSKLLAGEKDSAKRNAIVMQRTALRTALTNLSLVTL